jgi:tetratricopeptide (TPR) repeat protein
MRLLLRLSVFLPLLLANAARGQPNDGRDLELMAAFRDADRFETQATKAEHAGRLEDAERALWQALEIIELKGGRHHATTLERRSALARFFQRNGRHDDAERLLKQNLDVLETVPADEGRAVKLTERGDQLASFYEDRGRFAEAEAAWTSIAGLSDSPPAEANPYIDVRFAMLYARWRRFEDAQRHERQAATRIGSGMAAANPDTRSGPRQKAVVLATYALVRLASLADAYDLQGRPDLAEATYRLRLKLGQATYARSPQLHRDLASFYLERADAAHAEATLKDMLAMTGSRDPWATGELADLYAGQGRYGEAERLIKDLLASYEAMAAVPHWAVGDCLQRIAVLYARQGRHADAASLLERALSTVSAAEQSGTQRALWHKQLGDALKALGRTSEAQSRYATAEDALMRDTANSAAMPPAKRLDATLALARFYAEWDRPGDALPLTREALALGEKLYGPDHRWTAAPLQLQAELLERLGDLAQARDYAQRALAIRDRTRGAAHPDTQASRASLARIEARLHEQAAPLSTAN